MARPVMAAALACAAIVGLASCESAGSPSWAAEGKGERREPLKVAVTRVETARIERHYRTSGTLQAIRAAEIVPTQLGVIRSITVEEGDRVEAGDILARLDGREQALQATAATVELDSLERELRRLESISKNAVSAEEIDKQRYAVEQARVAARLSKHQAKQSIVRAPFAGTVIARHVDVGNLATTSTPLLSLADLSVLELELHLPERDAATVKVGTKVEVELIDGTIFEAAVARKAPVVDALTGTVKFTVQAREYPEGAMPGAFARAKVLVDSRDGVPSLSPKAIFEVDGKPHVYVVVDGKARRRPVELGLQGEDRVEIVSGLSDDDLVVAAGNAGITEGMPLRSASEEPDEKPQQAS